MRFAIQTGYGEALFLTIDRRWSSADDFLVLLIASHAQGLDWIAANQSCATIIARTPLVVPYDDLR